MGKRILALLAAAMLLLPVRAAACGSVSAGGGPAGYIALTFDDGPSGPATEAFLQALEQRGAACTFFICGYRMQDFPTDLSAYAAHGHELGVHGWSHIYLRSESRTTLETELGEKRARADEMLAELSADKQRLLEEITRVDAMEADLIAQIAQRQAELNDLPKDPDDPMPPTESGFLFPVDPSGFVYLSSPYGFRIHPITGIYTMHTGVDLASYQGTPVYASKSGEIDIAVYGYALGNYVVIDHGDGFSTLYAHMTHFVVGVGDYVTQGQVIGYVGSTGAYSNGPHLHFTVMYDGNTVNPMSYISLP